MDDVSSGAITSVAPHGGVSVHLEMNYFSPTPGNQECIVDARVTKAGRRLAFAEVDIRDKKSGKLCARGSHIKLIPPMPDPEDPSGKLPKGTAKGAGTPEGAQEFIAGLAADIQEGFDPDATQNFETTALHGLKDIAASKGKVVCVLPVAPRVQNPFGSLHGGCTGKQGSLAWYARSSQRRGAS